jgi:hypothetical protein
MGDEPYTTQRENFTSRPSRLSSHSTSPHHVAYATERARMLFGCYRRGDANDPETYVRAVGAVLSMFDADLIREVTDPRTGIMTTEKFMTFMPNAGELKVYCDGIAARRERLQRLGTRAKPAERLAPPPPVPGDLATIFVPMNNPRYPALVEWAKTADPRKWKYEAARPGIWIAHDIWDQRQMAARITPKADLPQRLELSEAARKVMADRDAERSGSLPVDLANREPAE